MTVQNVCRPYAPTAASHGAVGSPSAWGYKVHIWICQAPPRCSSEAAAHTSQTGNVCALWGVLRASLSATGSQRQAQVRVSSSCTCMLMGSVSRVLPCLLQVPVCCSSHPAMLLLAMGFAGGVVHAELIHSTIPVCLPAQPV